MPDSLVAKWLVRPLAAVGVVSVGSSSLPTTVGASSGQGTIGSSTTTVTPTPSATAIRPIKLGVNIHETPSYNRNRVFTNLATFEGWKLTTGGKLIEALAVPADYLDADRNIIKLSSTENASRILNAPTAVLAGMSADIICRWQGTGRVTVQNRPGVRNPSYGDHSLRFTEIPETGGGTPVIQMFTVSPTDPVRNLDCREATASPTQLFDPTWLANVKKYNTVRFMGWQRTNYNATVTWATRSKIGNAGLYGFDGYPIELMIEAANQGKVNPWFCMPWNADDDYIRKFAEMVRDRLDPSLVAYVEVSNEVWNGAFPVSNQAIREGLAEGLTTNSESARQLRYAEKTGQVMDIWSSVFAGQSQRLVRIAASQNSLYGRIKDIMAFRDTASKVDAIASAPYFEANLAGVTLSTDADIATFFANWRATLDKRLGTGNAAGYKAIAAQYGKRFIAYEAGQHATGNNTPLQYTLQRDPRMGQLYSYYLHRWQSDFGDLMMLFNDVDNVNQYGAWGLREYLGQPLSTAPKAKAVENMLASINNRN